MPNNQRIILPLLLTFIFLNSFFLLGKSFFYKLAMDRYVLMGANFLFFMIALITFFLHKNSLKNKNPNVFVRAVMKGLLLKMFFCIATLLIYYFASGIHFNKPAIYAGMGMYVLYLVIEVSVLLKLNKQKHAQ